MQENKITIQFLAKELGISVTTVSRVLNGLGEKYRISKKTIEKVNSTAENLNYSPNKLAKGLRLQKSYTLGFIIPNITNTWFAELALKIEDEARKNNYNIFLCNSNDDIKVEKKSVQLLQSWMVDGIIIAPIGLESEHLIKISKKGLPLVLIDRFFEGLPLPYICTNNFEGSLEANQYLIENGHKKIACFQGIIGTSANNQRLNGYQQALKNNHIVFDPELVMGADFGLNNGYIFAKKLIKELPISKITAIFSMGNQITLGILKACKEEKINIPKDISLISFDEQIYSDLLYTSLTTVSHMKENLGQICFKMLLDQFEKKQDSKPENVVLESKLIIRDSVKRI